MKNYEIEDCLSDFGDGILIKTYIRPGASKSEFSGIFGEPPRIKIRIKARPVEGQANKAVIKFLSQVLCLPKGEIELVRGLRGLSKDFYVEISKENILTKILDRKHQSRLE